MTHVFAFAAALPMRGLRFGPMRLTVYGACAAAGVVAGMALSGRAARRVGIDPEAAWDAGLFAVVCCFAASRLLLVLRDPVAFLHFPVLVLGLPSLTIGGMALAGLMVWVYVRRKRLAVLPMLDAFAPCGAILAACLELGHFLDGSEPGMPVVRGDARGGVGAVPVALYGTVLSVSIAVLLWARLRAETRSGRVVAAGLMLGGVVAFGLDMLTLPSDLFDTFWLEPGQMVDLGAMLTGAVLWCFAPRTIDNSPAGEVAETFAAASMEVR